jgi:orotate phosphoribosyltransferase
LGCADTQSSRNIEEEELAKILLHTGSLKFGLFTLSGGRLSQYYLDMRVIPSFPGAFQSATKLLTTSARKIEGVDKVGGIPTGGLVWASVLAYNLTRPLVYARKEVKHHGREKMVEGVLTPGEKVLVIDDVVTSGKSILNATESLRAEGGVVENVLVLLDREEGGEERLRKDGLKLHSVAKISAIAKRLFDIQAINKSQYDSIVESTKRPSKSEKTAE